SLASSARAGLHRSRGRSASGTGLGRHVPGPRFPVRRVALAHTPIRPDQLPRLCSRYEDRRKRGLVLWHVSRLPVRGRPTLRVEVALASRADGLQLPVRRQWPPIYRLPRGDAIAVVARRVGARRFWMAGDAARRVLESGDGTRLAHASAARLLLQTR